MTNMLSFVCFALAIVSGTWLAFSAVQSLTRRFAGVSASVVILGGRFGASAMVLPGFWLSIFIGAPLFGGMAIGIAGDQAMRLGTLLGVGVTQFIFVAFGGAVGASLPLVYHWIAHRAGANR